MKSPPKALSTVYLVYVAVEIVSVILVWRRRYHEPLKFRDPGLLVAADIMTYWALGATYFAEVFEVTSCWISVLLALPWILMMCMVVARFWKLIVIAHMTEARVQGRLDSWFLRHTWAAASRNIWRMILLGTALLFIAHVAVCMSQPNCRSSPIVILFEAFYVLLWWITIAVMTWKLRHVRDAFYAVSELQQLAALILIAGIAVAVMKLLHFAPEAISFLFPLIGVVQNWIQMWYPLWLSYRLQYRDVSVLRTFHSKSKPSMSGIRPYASRLTEDSDFLEIVKNSDGFAALKRFLTLEFSVENLLCWEQLHVHQSERNPAQVEAHFARVYDMFMKVGSPNEVNVSDSLKQQFRIVVEGQRTASPPRTVLEQLRSEGEVVPDSNTTETRLHLLTKLYYDIVKLISHDSFGRFRKSEEFRRLISLNETMTSLETAQKT